MKKLLISSLILLFSLNGWSQQDPLLSNYRFNQFIMNPAVAGSSGNWEIRAGYRNQWNRFSGSPVTGTMSVNTLIGRVGAGLNVVRDEAGPFTTFGAQMAYAYHIPFENMNLSLGLSGRWSRWGLDRFMTNPAEPDPTIAEWENFSSVDVGLGGLLYGENWHVGGSAPMIMQLIGDNIELARHFYLMGGYRHAFSDVFALEPSMILRVMPGAPVGFDLDLRSFLIEEQLFLGLGVRSDFTFDNNFLSFMTGFHIQDQYLLAYAYDHALNSVFQEESWGSHEITLGINIGSIRGFQASPRTATPVEVPPAEAAPRPRPEDVDAPEPAQPVEVE